MRAAALMLLLAVPASGASLEEIGRELTRQTVEVFVAEAAKKAGIPASPVVIGVSEVYLAWVRTDPLEFVIYVEEDHVANSQEWQLCRSAHHEVCHQKLSLTGANDDDAHVAVDRCMKQIRVEQCWEGWD